MRREDIPEDVADYLHECVQADVDGAKDIYNTLSAILKRGHKSTAPRSTPPQKKTPQKTQATHNGETKEEQAEIVNLHQVEPSSTMIEEVAEAVPADEVEHELRMQTPPQLQVPGTNFIRNLFSPGLFVKA